MDRPCVGLAGLILLSSLALSGCAPRASAKPETSPPTPQGAGKEARREEARTAARESPTASRSLEAVRRGETPETPASSPLKEVYFDFDRYDIRPDARETLKANAQWLKTNPSAWVEVEGHCDERGTNEYNLALGAKRAQAAKDYLVSVGVSAGRLSTISYGEEVPVCKEQNEDCWQKNRRARFVIIPAKPLS